MTFYVRTNSRPLLFPLAAVRLGRETELLYLKVIQSFRQGPRPVLLDIHDGSNVSEDTQGDAIAHLHHCDLLVLDYQLDKDMPGDGTRAIELLKNLMSNEHFNLVVIYTIEELDRVFDTVRWQLIMPSSPRLSEEERRQAEVLISEEEDRIEGFENGVTASIGASQYFHSRRNQDRYRRIMALDQEPYGEFAHWAKQSSWDNDQKFLVLRHLLDNLERDKITTSPFQRRFSDLDWSSSDAKWIKSDSAFVALSSKKDNQYDLLSELRSALIDWKPWPSRLFLAKLQAEIYNFGAVAQRSALSDRHALAYWYYLLVTTTDTNDRRYRISDTLSRHSEQLLKTILPRVEDFVKRLVESDIAQANAPTVCSRHFAVDLDLPKDRTLAELQHNAYVCSTDPVGSHLSTGQIFLMADEYWLCLSPACDMVPSQVPRWRRTEFGNNLPFIGIQLQKVNENREHDIRSNRYLFLRLSEKVSVFCFNEASDVEAPPKWHLLYASDLGRFSDDQFRFTVGMIKTDGTGLSYKECPAQVISQLRYPYALNLIQKLGMSLTRIGLDFAAIAGGV